MIPGSRTQGPLSRTTHLPPLLPNRPLPNIMNPTPIARLSLLAILLTATPLESLQATPEAPSTPPSRQDTGSKPPALAGVWIGSFTVPQGKAALELRFTHDTGGWKATGTAIVGPPPGKAAPFTAKELSVKGADVSFKADIHGAEVVFHGQLDQQSLAGKLTAVENGTPVGEGQWTVNHTTTGAAGVSHREIP